MSLVLDCSATLAWVYGEETTEAVREVFEAVGSSGAWVPALWRLEVDNVLEMGVRRNRYDDAFWDPTLRDLALLPIRLDPETDQHAGAVGGFDLAVELKRAEVQPQALGARR